jgi:hypothetical protein
VATQVPIANLQSLVCAAVQATPDLRSGKSTGPPAQESSAPRLFAHLVEFVAHPGKAERLQTEIPLALSRASGRSEGFAGCIVLFSEQEARLVTLITLWRDGNHANECNGNSTRLKTLLGPSVDRWLRTRSFHTFVSLAQ